MAAAQLSSRPLYLRIRDALAERIAKGEWKPGAALPNEGDLAREYGVSAGTMRKALDLLENERLVTRRQGRGTFVNDQSSNELAARFLNIRRPDGERVIGEVKTAEIAAGAANEMECARLHLQAGDGVHRVRRVRLVDDRPFMVEEATLPAALFPDLEGMSTFTYRILYLAQKNGVLLGRAEERISISEATAEIAQALDVAPRSPVAVLDRIVHTIDGQAAEWRVAWCHLGENYYLAQIT